MQPHKNTYYIHILLCIDGFLKISFNNTTKLSGFNTYSTSQFIHSPAWTKVLVSVKDLSFNKSMFSSRHNIGREF